MAVVLHRPLLVVIQAWPAIVASSLVANFRRELLGRREVRDVPAGLLPPLTIAFAVLLFVAFACTAAFAVIVAGDDRLQVRTAWEAVRPRLWLLALAALATAAIAVPAVAVAADASRGAYLLVNGGAVAVLLALLVSVPVIALGVGRRRETLTAKAGRWLVTATVGVLVSAANLLIGGAGRALTDSRFLWWLGAAAVVVAIGLNVLALAALRAVRAGAAIARRDGG